MTFLPRGLLAAQNLIDGPNCTIGPKRMFSCPLSKNINKCFIRPIFGFWSLLETKFRKYDIIFVYILQGKMGRTEKERKENHATKVTKIPKTKRQKYGMNKTKQVFIFVTSNRTCLMSLNFSLNLGPSLHRRSGDQFFSEGPPQCKVRFDPLLSNCQ